MRRRREGGADAERHRAPPHPPRTPSFRAIADETFKRARAWIRIHKCARREGRSSPPPPSNSGGSDTEDCAGGRSVPGPLSLPGRGRVGAPQSAWCPGSCIRRAVAPPTRPWGGAASAHAGHTASSSSWRRPASAPRCSQPRARHPPGVTPGTQGPASQGGPRPKRPVRPAFLQRPHPSPLPRGCDVWEREGRGPSA